MADQWFTTLATCFDLTENELKREIVTFIASLPDPGVTERAVGNWPKAKTYPHSRGRATLIAFIGKFQEHQKPSNSDEINRILLELGPIRQEHTGELYPGLLHIANIYSDLIENDPKIPQHEDAYKGIYRIIRKSNWKDVDRYYEEIVCVADRFGITEHVNKDGCIYRGVSIFSTGVINIIVASPDSQWRLGFRFIKIQLPARKGNSTAYSGVMLRLSSGGARPVAIPIVALPVTDDVEKHEIAELLRASEANTQIPDFEFAIQNDPVNYIREVTKGDPMFSQYQRMPLGPSVIAGTHGELQRALWDQNKG